jgi:hypothetical protein
MQSFAQDTRHRIRDPSDESAIALKFLCTQLPHWQLVYPHIADDLESVNYRAPNMLDNYAKYKHVSPEILSQLTNVSTTISSPLIDHFAETVGFPVTDKKTYGFFLLGQKHKNLDKHIEYLLPGDDHFTERKRLFKAIQDFELPSEPSVVEQMVDILTQIPKGEMIQDVKEEEIVKKTPDFVELDRKINLPDPSSSPAADSLENHPLVTEFKQLAGLASHFPTKKVVNQILGSMVGADVSKFMGKFQTEVPSLSVKKDWKDLLQIYPAEKLQELIETPEMEEFYYHLKEDKKPKDKLECVQAFLEFSLCEELIKKLLV